MPPEKITAKQVLSALRSYSAHIEPRPVWLVEHEQETWVVTEHFAFRPNAKALFAFQDLFTICNLTFKGPLRSIVDLAVTKLSTDTPELTRIIPDMETLAEIEPRPLADGTLYHEQIEDQPTEIWRRKDGTWTTLNADYARMIRHFGAAEQWMQGPDALANPVVGFEGGAFSAFLTPLVVTEERRLIRDPDLPATLWDSFEE